MSPRHAARRFGRKHKSIVGRIAFERLECRLALALLVPAADADANVRYLSIIDDPPAVSDPTQASVSAAAGPAFGIFQTSAHATAESSGLVVGRALAGGAGFAPTPPIDTLAASNSQGTANWIVAGVPAGQPVSVDVTVSVSGVLQNSSNGLVQPNDYTSGVTARLRLSSDAGPTQTLFHAAAHLHRQVMVVNGTWTFTDSSSGQVRRYDTSHTETISFTVPALEPFSLSTELATSAATAHVFEISAIADFESSGGLSYAVSTSEPGARVDSYGPGSDTDGDGVEDAVEDAGPNGGDVGRCGPLAVVIGDGHPDSVQATVATYFDSAANDYVTLVLCGADGNAPPAGASLANVRDASARPPGSLNTVAAFEAEVRGLTPGTSVLIKVLRLSGADVES